MTTGFFQEATGSKSTARAIFVGGMIWAMGFTTIGTFALDWTPGNIIAVFGALSGVFIGLKLGQKPLEEKNGK